MRSSSLLTQEKDGALTVVKVPGTLLLKLSLADDFHLVAVTCPTKGSTRLPPRPKKARPGRLRGSERCFVPTCPP